MFYCLGQVNTTQGKIRLLLICVSICIMSGKGIQYVKIMYLQEKCVVLEREKSELLQRTFDAEKDKERALVRMERVGEQQKDLDEMKQRLQRREEAIQVRVSAEILFLVTFCCERLHLFETETALEVVSNYKLACQENRQKLEED